MSQLVEHFIMCVDPAGVDREAFTIIAVRSDGLLSVVDAWTREPETIDWVAWVKERMRPTPAGSCAFCGRTLLHDDVEAIWPDEYGDPKCNLCQQRDEVAACTSCGAVHPVADLEPNGGICGKCIAEGEVEPPERWSDE